MKKVRQNTIPHYIIIIDAALLFFVVKKCKNNHIPIYTIHDCFVVPENYETHINHFYKEAYIEHYQMNLLEKFIRDNLDLNSLSENDKKKIDAILSQISPPIMTDFQAKPLKKETFYEDIKNKNGKKIE